ncbi:unnamed protein product [Boreogadus saida]
MGDLIDMNNISWECLCRCGVLTGQQEQRCTDSTERASGLKARQTRRETQLDDPAAGQGRSRRSQEDHLDARPANM